ncbi:MAG: hypothetical protein HZA04_05330 [Nitrospinae bacterium]|nr:hypothetical protein [Nitrospinota bacterium]
MITKKAPTRIDLAGGTLDIWPLSVMFAPAVSLNAAIDLYATVQARKTKTPGAAVHARHYEKTITCSESVPEKHKTLFHRAYEFLPAPGWVFEADCLSPSGAGLGGSSSLLIAFLKALNAIRKEGLSDLDILDAAKNIEARHLGIPTGVQDYVAALNGGVMATVCAAEGFRYERVKVPAREIERRVVLAYSGESRISGVPNWLMLKNAVEKKQQTVEAFSRIAANSLKVRAALEKGNFGAVGKLIDVESLWRERLGKGVITPRLRRAFSAAQKAGGHPKVCGAGGGGCFMVWCAPAQKEEIAAALAALGHRILDFHVADAHAGD